MKAALVLAVLLLSATSQAETKPYDPFVRGSVQPVPQTLPARPAGAAQPLPPIYNPAPQPAAQPVPYAPPRQGGFRPGPAWSPDPVDDGGYDEGDRGGWFPGDDRRGDRRHGHGDGGPDPRGQPGGGWNPFGDDGH
jgi:hypothetical protein